MIYEIGRISFSDLDLGVFADHFFLACRLNSSYCPLRKGFGCMSVLSSVVTCAGGDSTSLTPNKIGLVAALGRCLQVKFCLAVQPAANGELALSDIADFVYGFFRVVIIWMGERA